MKVIHCADLHLDSRMSANLSIEAARERNAELLSTFKRLVDYANSVEAKAIMISGDLFDTAKVKHRTREFICGLIEQNPHITFLYLRGNHDRFEDLDCSCDNLITFSDKWSYIQIDNLTIAGIELDKYNSNSYYDELNLSDSSINIVMLHGEINKYPGEEKIVLEKLSNHNIDYMALGHIHDHSSGTIDGRGTWVYSGCLEGRGFDECGQKGFVELDILDNSIQWRFVPFQRRTLESISVDISDASDMAEILMKISNKLGDIPFSSIVRVILTGEYQLNFRKDIRIINAHLSEKFYSVKVLDKSKLYIDKDKYEFDISLKGELIRLIKSDDNLSEDEKDLMIVLGIQALSGEELSI